MKSLNKGFTLIEVMIAVAIIALVSGCIFSMFSTSSRVNRRAKEIDMANISAVSEAEKVKKDPETFIKESSVGTTEIKDQTTVTTAVGKKYYDYSWKETTETDAEFTLTTTVKKTEVLGGFSSYAPNNDSSDNYELFKTKNNNLIVAIDKDGGSNDYQVFILEYTYREFADDLLKKELDKQDNDDYGYTLALKTVLSTYGVEYKKDDGESGNLGSIPMYLTLNEQTNADDYNLDIYNLSKKQIDLYLRNNKSIKDKLKLSVISGTANVTYLSDERNTQSDYNINVQITRKKDSKILADYSVREGK